MRDRLTYPDPLDAVINPAYQNQILEIDFFFRNPMGYSRGEWNTQFVKGYGIGVSKREIVGTGSSLLFWNGLSPMSAVLSGKEVSFEEATSKFVVEPDLPPIWGQLGKISNQSGFDFSKGTESYGLKEDIGFGQRTDQDGFGDGPPYLSSRIGMATLGQVEFGSLVSEGRPDLRLDPPERVFTDGTFRWLKTCQEGDTYALWSREGGIALMHILDISLNSRGTVRHMLFDWVYYPASDRSPDTTSVQPTSWGQLKASLLRTK